MEIIEVEFWYWWIFAVALIIFELFVPGSFFLWMGVAAAIIGAVVMFIPLLPWEYQVLGFSIFSVTSVVFWRRHLKKNPTDTDQPLLNRRSAQYVGRTFTLEQPLENGRGKIQVDDSVWKIKGEDCPANSRVQVVATEGVYLVVEKID